MAQVLLFLKIIPQKNKSGGHFGPEKKYLAPPPPNLPTRCRHPPGPSRPEDPPPGIFNRKPNPPPPGASHSPLPLPKQKHNKKYPKRPPRLLKHHFCP